MSQLNFIGRSELENPHQHAKQFGASEVSRSTIKKTALTDVKNILAQRTVHSSKKVQTSTAKFNINKKNLISSSKNKENEISEREIKQAELELSQVKKVGTTYNSVHTVETNNDSADIEFVDPVCYCDDNIEDGYGDIMLKNITLTKSEIDSLATEWERPPIVSEKDMRKIEIPSEIPFVKVSISDWPDLFIEVYNEYNELDLSFLNDIPAVGSDSDIEE